MIEESGKIKIIKYIALVIAIIILIISGYLAYQIFQTKINTPTTAANPPKSSSSPDSTKKELAKTFANCSSTLSAAEKNLIKSWQTFENTKYDYSFKYPSNWEIQSNANKDEIVSLVYNPTDDLAMSTNFQFRAAAKVAEVISNTEGLTLESQKRITVDCITAQYSVYITSSQIPGGRDGREIRTLLTKEGTQFLSAIWYPAADPSDFPENYDLLLKTIDFE